MNHGKCGAELQPVLNSLITTVGIYADGSLCNPKLINFGRVANSECQKTPVFTCCLSNTEF